MLIWLPSSCTKTCEYWLDANKTSMTRPTSSPRSGRLSRLLRPDHPRPSQRDGAGEQAVRPADRRRRREHREADDVQRPKSGSTLIREATGHLENVEIRTFTGLAVTFVKQCGARIMVRGVRPDHRHRRRVDDDDGQPPPGPRRGNALHDRRRRVGPRLQFADQADRLGGRRRRAFPLPAAERGAGRCERGWNGTRRSNLRCGDRGETVSRPEMCREVSWP